jgi:hypothetical protein
MNKDDRFFFFTRKNKIEPQNTRPINIISETPVTLALKAN